jgi:Fe/S biogenesis protein NfuA
MDPMTTEADAAILTVTDKARARIVEIRADEPDADDLVLHLEISGVAGGNYSYDMWLERRGEIPDDAVVTEHDGVTVVIPACDVDRLRGATLDLSRDLLRPGMVLQNPNRPVVPAMATGAASPSMGRPPADLSGDVPQQVIQVLEQQINPSIAAHGGRAELVAVEDGIAYLRLSGGCQGCGLASVTLTQGIAVAIQEAIPEIVEVIDVTDHASGHNPYFEAAKK